MDEDKTLHALVAENNRMLRALSKTVGGEELGPTPNRAPTAEPFNHLMKSKPATDTEDCQHIPAGGTSRCSAVPCRKWDGHGGPHDPAPQPSGNPGEFNVGAAMAEMGRQMYPDEPCKEAGCVLNIGHFNGHSTKYGTWHIEGPLKPHPEPVHDFGWALQQMRAGKKVRTGVFRTGAAIGLAANEFRWYFEGAVENWNHTSMGLLATDWQVVE